jgi:DNA repair protein RecN (Recombination protein N)
LLSHLLIRNLAVVDEVEIETGAGLTVLTGETGAGKSILVDALALALGERADSDAVRPGAARAEISASFDLASDDAAALWLAARDLDADDTDCVIRRVISAEGRSRGYINGHPVPMQTLRELGELLVDICGQAAHQSLAKPDTQRQLLDQHGGHIALVLNVRAAYTKWQALNDEYAALGASRADQAARLDLLQFQVQELLALDAQPGELAHIETAHQLAANATRLSSGAGEALTALYEGAGGDDSTTVHDLISNTRNLLDELSQLDPALKDIAQMLADAEIQVSEAADSLRRYLNTDFAGDTDLASLEARLSAMHDLARKHRIKPAELPELAEKLQNDLHKIVHADDTLDELRQQVAAAANELNALSTKLSKARDKTAGMLGKAVTINMQQLGMPQGQFSIALQKQAALGPNGQERVEFRVAINPGLKPGALNKVASGGELSRVSLAIQVAASSQAHTPTLIFDEVDAGIGGSTADIVGEKLRELAEISQVLCVTHLPQVASKGHGHFRVSKLTDGETTRTRVAPLNHEERIEELSRMLGGTEITARTRAHAEEMLDSALHKKAS